jgi:hypothetical protein
MEPTVSTGLKIGEVLGNAFQETVNSLMEAIGVVLPIALPIMGIGIAIGFTTKLFRKLTSKGA